MGVVFSFHRQPKVEHVGHGGHVNAASGHVGCHQNLHLALAQRHQAAIAQTLAQSTVQGNGAEAFLLQVIGQTVALNLGTGKHNGLVDGGVAQPVVEQLALVVRIVCPEQHLLDVAVLFLRAVDLQTLWLTHHAGGTFSTRLASPESVSKLCLAGMTRR